MINILVADDAELNRIVCMMPGMDGFEIKTVRELGHKAVTK